MKNMDERIRKRIEDIKLLLGMSGFGEFYDDEEIERIARLPIELSLPLLTQLSMCANLVSREVREEEKEEKEKFQEENVWIHSLSNNVNTVWISELCEYMKRNGLSESHINNTLKTNMLFSEFLGAGVSFYDVQKKEQIINFLDDGIKMIAWLIVWLLPRIFHLK